MRCFNGKKLSCERAGHPEYIHAQMTTIFRCSGFSSLFVPTLSGTGITLKSRFVGKPDTLIRLVEQ